MSEGLRRPGSHKITLKTLIKSRGYKTFFMFMSTELNFFLLTNVKMPTIVGILTFMSRKNSILGLSEPNKSRIS